MFGNIESYTEKIVDFSNFEWSQLFDALMFGGAMLLIGMAAVFAVLFILWLFLGLFKLVFHDLPKNRKNKKVEVAPVKVVEEVTSDKNNDEELIAVISAAIAMAEGDDSGLKFRVVSFKRT